jgi:plastin-1
MAANEVRRASRVGRVADKSRLSINQTLASISKNGKGVTDQEIVRWANETVQKGGKSSTMRSFKDPSLSNAVFFLDLLNGIRPGIVDYSLVNSGTGSEDKRMNGTCSAAASDQADILPAAKLAISIARKMGALIFLVPEGEWRFVVGTALTVSLDIVDVRPRLVSQMNINDPRLTRQDPHLRGSALERIVAAVGTGRTEKAKVAGDCYAIT